MVQIDRFFCGHGRRSTGIRSIDRRHDRGTAYPQTIEFLNAEFRIDHSISACAHSLRVNPMLIGFGSATGIVGGLCDEPDIPPGRDLFSAAERAP